jgi:4-alpha-glucanotransferase
MGFQNGLDGKKRVIDRCLAGKQESLLGGVHMNQRASGILLHPTSLSNPDPIGDLGPAATTFADFLVQGGQRWWQMLPIGPAGEKNSPCQSLSAFGGNPLLVSPDLLVEQGLVGRQDIELSIFGARERWTIPRRHT